MAGNREADDYCELCDLALSQCVHGQPPPAPVVAVGRATPQPRARAVSDRPAKPRVSKAVTSRRVERKWTPHAELRPHILRVLREHGGRLEADDLMLELEIRLENVLTPGDREQTPQGEERWHTATRRERKALTDDGLLVPAQPGLWELTPAGLSPAAD